MARVSLKRIPRRLPSLVLQAEISHEETSKHPVKLEEFDQRCYQVFEQLRRKLIANQYNWFIIIEPNSGNYFMDEDELVAFQKALEKHPQRIFGFFRLNETGVCGKI
ncbi:MAG: hypothetical protein Fur006_01260 [Coleofasciculaceae cyanobacterium]